MIASMKIVDQLLDPKNMLDNVKKEEFLTTLENEQVFDGLANAIFKK